MHISGEFNLTIPNDATKLEEVFIQLLEVTSARVKSLGYDLVFILIDNAEQLVVLGYDMCKLYNNY